MIPGVHLCNLVKCCSEWSWGFCIQQSGLQGSCLQGWAMTQWKWYKWLNFWCISGLKQLWLSSSPFLSVHAHSIVPGVKCSLEQSGFPFAIYRLFHAQPASWLLAARISMENLDVEELLKSSLLLEVLGGGLWCSRCSAAFLTAAAGGANRVVM